MQHELQDALRRRHRSIRANVAKLDDAKRAQMVEIWLFAASFGTVLALAWTVLG
ncbi:MAG: hypothetical protein AAF321_00240 [Pseudomonadota bacterium]